MLKIAEGDRGHSRRGNPEEKLANEPAPERGFGPRPEHLTGDAAYAWDFITEQLTVMQMDYASDQLALEHACNAFAVSRQAQRAIDEHGITVKGSHGGEQQSPNVIIARESRKEFLAFCTHFGLTPCARARLSVQGKDEELAAVEAALSKPRERKTA